MLTLPLWELAAAAGLLGLVVGSFLNVVIHRLPKMLERQWQQDCAEITSQGGESRVPVTYNLLLPRSHCPKCNHTLTVRENFPLLSFLLQRGCCRGCGASISWRYPLIEAISGLGAAIVVWHFGPTFQAIAALFLTWTLIAASAIDLEHQLLPDVMMLPLLWAGVALSLWEVYVDPTQSIIGVMAGYVSLWSVYWLFRLLTGKEGMGHGDFKLLAALGAWMGWQMLPAVVFLSSLVGAVVGVTLVVLGRDRNRPIPFGPFLATAGWVSLLWGQEGFHVYLRLIQPL